MMHKGIRIHLNSVVFVTLFIGVFLLEVQFYIFERGVGLYLKWQNPNRSQLGRIWDRDRQNILAQRKIQSLLTNLDFRKQTSESFDSIDQIFKTLFSGSSQVISREKFLELYYNYPGEWSRHLVSSLDLIKIDSRRSWNKVLFKRLGPWITMSFIDRENFPIREFHVSLSQLNEIQSNRIISQETLVEAGFLEERVFSFDKLVPILKTMDPDSRRVLLPDPQWFLERDYHVTRIGFYETFRANKDVQKMLVGVEYQTDFYTHVLQIRVPIEIGLNILSQIEKGDLESLAGDTDVIYENTQD